MVLIAARSAVTHCGSQCLVQLAYCLCCLLLQWCLYCSSVCFGLPRVMVGLYCSDGKLAGRTHPQQTSENRLSPKATQTLHLWQLLLHRLWLAWALLLKVVLHTIHTLLLTLCTGFRLASVYWIALNVLGRVDLLRSISHSVYQVWLMVVHQPLAARLRKGMSML